MAIKAAWDKGIDVISTARNIAEEEGFELGTHTKVQCGDGGISLRQA